MQKALLVISALMIAGAGVLLAWANWPAVSVNREVNLHLIAPDAWSQSNRQLVEAISFQQNLITHKKAKVGQRVDFQLLVRGLPAQVIVDGNNYRLRVRCELILPGFLNDQEGMLTQSVIGGEALRFTWAIQAIEARTAGGVLRSYVEYISMDGETQSKLLSVYEIDLTSHSLFGFSIRNANYLAVVLILLAGLSGGLVLTTRQA
ncbi:MAG: hypothetical protein JW704_04895 [Anaerolineaceae bacterium]|nr:hypothetical protein [Anaerolineaceae bacterium]MBN2676633.1 hypothetical protein [Anaerolineaceae bacterium]